MQRALPAVPSHGCRRDHGGAAACVFVAVADVLIGDLVFSVGAFLACGVRGGVHAVAPCGRKDVGEGHVGAAVQQDAGGPRHAGGAE
jgi:hypothetical protein